jgi:hypothetical protein
MAQAGAEDDADPGGLDRGPLDALGGLDDACREINTRIAFSAHGRRRETLLHNALGV